MKSVSIVLGTIEKAKHFVHDMGCIEGKVIICLGRYYIDAKSIMGVLTLNLTNPIRLEITDWRDEYEEIVRKYMAVRN